ncbi:MAG: endonuclease [Schleiferiaceae bacterium]|nr:endonuclease [Schleiferiaceae bacterium]
MNEIRFMVLMCLFGMSLSGLKAQVPAGYYQSTQGLQGSALRDSLNALISNHTAFPYTASGTDTWDILQESDKDPQDSSKLVLVYSDTTVDGPQEYNAGAGWSREHVWPQSLMSASPSTSSPGPETDVHNLKPAAIAVNSSRSNKIYDNGGSAHPSIADTYTDADSWEPRDSVKGDLARIIFYMAVRYEGQNGEPDLRLTDSIKGLPGQFAVRSTLLAWHRLDPVTAFERHRNDVIYSYQNNRNPFIDHPGYVSKIWGVDTGLAPPLVFNPYPTGPSQVSLDFQANAAQDTVVIVYNASGNFTAPTGRPVVGQALAGGQVLSVDTVAPAIHGGLTKGQQVFYRAFSYDDNIYSTSLSAVLTTPSTSLPYQEAFSNQHGKGKNGTSPVDLSGVDWSVDVSQGSFTASDDFFAVKNGVFEAQDVDGLVTWRSPTFFVDSFKTAHLRMDLLADGDFEKNQDVLAVSLINDPGTSQATSQPIFTGSVDESLAGDPFLVAQQRLADTLQRFHKQFPLSGATACLEIKVLVNAGSEKIAWDNIALNRVFFYDGTRWTPRRPEGNAGLEDDIVVAGGHPRLTAPTQGRRLRVQSGASLTLSPNASLTLAERIDNAGTVTLTDGASLVQTAPLDQNTTTGTYHVRRQTGLYGNPTYYSLWSSPVKNAQIESVFANTNQADRYEFDLAAQNWAAYPTGKMQSGRGYFVTGNASGGAQFRDTRVFSGEVHNGTLRDTLLTAPAGTFIALGNPYPSAIGLFRFFNANPKLTGDAYFWHHAAALQNNSPQSRDYLTVNKSGATQSPADSLATTGQGFVVRVAQPLNEVVFHNSMRTAEGNDMFFKSTRPPRYRFWLAARHDSGQHNNILMALSPQATAQYDEGWDALKLKGNPDIAFYSLQGNKELAIQALDQDLSQDKIIPLGLDAGQTGQYTIALDSLNNWPGYTIALLDSAQGTVTNLKQTDYRFAVNQPGAIRGRFYLLISSQPFVGIEEENARSGELLYFQRGEALIVDSRLQNSPLEAVTLRSVSGRTVRQATPGTLRYELSVSDLPQGVYLLETHNQAGATTHHKVYLK